MTIWSFSIFKLLDLFHLFYNLSKAFFWFFFITCRKTRLPSLYSFLKKELAEQAYKKSCDVSNLRKISLFHDQHNTVVKPSKTFRACPSYFTIIILCSKHRRPNFCSRLKQLNQNQHQGPYLVTLEKKRFPSGSTVKRDELIVFRAPFVLWGSVEVSIVTCALLRNCSFHLNV